MHRYSHRVGPALTMLALGLTLLAPGAARAANSYKIQPIAQVGDTVGDLKIQHGFAVGSLNDSGQLVFLTATNIAGFGYTLGQALLFQYTNGKLIPLVVTGQDAPGGKWAGDVHITVPLSMNQHGNIVFGANVTANGTTNTGTFLWDYQAQKLTAVALSGMPAVDDLTFIQGGGFGAAINNRDEIAFAAQVKEPTSPRHPEGYGYGVFFLGQDGKLQPVALPDQERPGGGQSFGFAGSPSINDAGAVAFIEAQLGEPNDSAYRWENGALTPLALYDAPAPGGGTIGVQMVWLNNKNRNVLVESSSTGDKPLSLYRFADGQLTAAAVRGQEMPGGGQFATDQYWAVSAGNDLGQHAVLAQLKDGATAAYLMDADGTLSLILKSGTTTDLGVITGVGTRTLLNGVGLNNKGQVALTLTIGNGPATLALLTPAAPQ